MSIMKDINSNVNCHLFFHKSRPSAAEKRASPHLFDFSNWRLNIKVYHWIKPLRSNIMLNSGTNAAGRQQKQTISMTQPAHSGVSTKLHAHLLPAGHRQKPTALQIPQPCQLWITALIYTQRSWIGQKKMYRNIYTHSERANLKRYIVEMVRKKRKAANSDI